MEASPTVDDTLALYRAAAARSELTGVAIQAYLRRTPEDIAGLVEQEIARVRLVKGAYSEPREIAWQRADRIRRAYRGALEQLTSTPAMAGGGSVGVATHDPQLHRATRRLIAEREVPDAAWEFQVLYGVRPQLRRELIERGERVRVSGPLRRELVPLLRPPHRRAPQQRPLRPPRHRRALTPTVRATAECPRCELRRWTSSASFAGR